MMKALPGFVAEASLYRRSRYRLEIEMPFSGTERRVWPSLMGIPAPDGGGPLPGGPFPGGEIPPGMPWPWPRHCYFYCRIRCADVCLPSGVCFETSNCRLECRYECVP